MKDVDLDEKQLGPGTVRKRCQGPPARGVKPPQELLLRPARGVILERRSLPGPLRGVLRPNKCTIDVGDLGLRT